MAPPKHESKRDKKGRFQRHTQADKRIFVPKVEPKSGSSSSTSSGVCEVCKCGKLKVHGKVCSCLASSKRKQVLIALDSDSEDDSPQQFRVCAGRGKHAKASGGREKHAEASSGRGKHAEARSGKGKRAPSCDSKMRKEARQVVAERSMPRQAVAERSMPRQAVDYLDILVQQLDIVIKKLDILMDKLDVVIEKM
ncbi:hypothetical protein GUJ93_ZPchr0009g309 [Zizania palustris]|uniref:Uncharacterized protein n=1 Tax=Zizania palustris TaxID=103762 RepID=A0A8J5R860_ZIZPA|nr:hypothetical protein GUJ93_ZPchr0009g309 [Zizania palustris]